MDDTILFGLDVHKATVSVAIAEAKRGGEVRSLGVVANRPDHIGEMVGPLASGGRRLGFCYQAGRAATGSTGNSPASAMPASWWRSR